MNRLYVNGLIWHLTKKTTISQAVDECIALGVWDSGYTAEVELCTESDTVLEYVPNYKHWR